MSSEKQDDLELAGMSAATSASLQESVAPPDLSLVEPSIAFSGLLGSAAAETLDDGTSLLRNKLHYDEQLRHTSIGRLANLCKGVDGLLADLTATDTSWVALYHAGFRERLAGAEVLEIGSGTGLNALVMALLGAQVTAIDVSKVASELLTDAAKVVGVESRIRAVTGDLSTFDLPQQHFDFVVGKAILHHLTHDMEDSYLEQVAGLLRPSGEARFAEPAVNSRLLNTLRWLVPLPGRPSMLDTAAFKTYRHESPHPDRDNSTEHYRAVGLRYFEETTAVPFGAIERLHRLMPSGSFNRSFRRVAFRAERLLPASVRFAAARAQLLCFTQPRTTGKSPGSRP